MSDRRTARIARSGPEGRTVDSVQATKLQKTRGPAGQAVHAGPVGDGPKLPAGMNRRRFDQSGLRNFLPKNSMTTNATATEAATTAKVRNSSRDKPKS